MPATIGIIRSLHQTTIVDSNAGGATLRRHLDTTLYFVTMQYSGAVIVQRQPHYFVLSPLPADTFTLGRAFSLPLWAPSPLPGPERRRHPRSHGGNTGPKERPWIFRAARMAGLPNWRDVSYSRNTSPGYRMPGDYPPQETGSPTTAGSGSSISRCTGGTRRSSHSGVILNYWKDHSIGTSTAAPGAGAIAARQGYEGDRWQKMTDPSGREAPSSVGSYLIWQQPNFIYLAELCYRAEKDPAVAKALLEKYAPLVFGTAGFMASYARYDSGTRRYILGPGLIPAAGALQMRQHLQPCFELAYWRWALTIAQQWRNRLGLPPDTASQRVLDGLSGLPQQDGLYYPAESAADAYTKSALSRRPSCGVLATFGVLPATKGLDTAVMHATLRLDRKRTGTGGHYLGMGLSADGDDRYAPGEARKGDRIPSEASAEKYLSS